MKPVSDALNNWIKTLITNHNHSRMKFCSTLSIKERRYFD